jgi:hypothetical protein
MASCAEYVCASPHVRDATQTSHQCDVGSHTGAGHTATHLAHGAWLAEAVNAAVIARRLGQAVLVAQRGAVRRGEQGPAQGGGMWGYSTIRKTCSAVKATPMHRVTYSMSVNPSSEPHLAGDTWRGPSTRQPQHAACCKPLHPRQTAGPECTAVIFPAVGALVLSQHHVADLAVHPALQEA